MKTLILLAGLGIGVWSLSSCDKAAQPSTCSDTTISELEENAGKANVRIKNETGMDLCQVLLNAQNTDLEEDEEPSGDLFYGNLPAYRYSDYTAVHGVRALAYIKATTPKTSYYLAPTDYMGLERLEPGRYTFVIKKYNGNCDSCLTLTIVRD